MAAMERRLDDLSERLNNRPERNQPASLQDSLTQLHGLSDLCSAHITPVEVLKQLPESAPWVDEIQPQPRDRSCNKADDPYLNSLCDARDVGVVEGRPQYSEKLLPMQVQSYEYQLVFDRSGSRAVLMSALDQALHRLIIVCPWLSRNSIDADLMQKFRDCLNRNCRIDIGWGFLSGRGKTGKGFGNSALKNLRQLEQDYPEQFKLKLLGTHEKFLVCDDSFTFLGSHNMLTSNTQGITREVGIRTTDTSIIQGLIDRFDGAEVQDAQAIDKNLKASEVNLDDVVEPDEDEDTDDSASYSQSPAIDAEELLRRYKAGERDFTGINLARVDLTSADLSSANLTEANLSGTNLTKAVLGNANLLEANLSKANLSNAQLVSANLTGADLSKAKLTNAKLNGANLSGANLPGVKAIGVDFFGVNLSGADLSRADLRGASAAWRK